VLLVSSDKSLVQEQSHKRHLILISGFIHDVGSFINEHPGGPHMLIKFIGKDATTAFFGGVYDHSNAAHNVSSCLSSRMTVDLTEFIAPRDEACRCAARWYASRV
jgi:cytochrome b involved in lipid metabolism